MSVRWTPRLLLGRRPAHVVVSGRWLVVAEPGTGLASLLHRIDAEAESGATLLDNVGLSSQHWGGAVAIVDLGADPVAIAATEGMHVGSGEPGAVDWQTRTGWAGPLAAGTVAVSIDRDAVAEPAGGDLVVCGVVLSRTGVPVPPDTPSSPQSLQVSGASGPQRPGGHVHTPGRPRPRPDPAPTAPSGDDLDEFELIDLQVPTNVRPVEPSRPGASLQDATYAPAVSEAVRRIVEQARGKRCAADHLNHPLARYCYRCGRGFDATASVVLMHGPRPPLGVLVDPAGRRHPVDGSLVVGRLPARDPEVTAGRATPVEVHGELVSRVHLHVAARDWDVVATDRSANGTFLWVPGGWRQLPQGSPVTLEPGSALRLGPAGGEEARIRFLSHHLANDAPAHP